MNRRDVLAALTLALAPATTAWAENKPWAANILNGRMQDGRWTAGLEFMLQPHWKTYWRVPGQGGVPPFIEVKGDNVKSFRFDCPTPTRFPSDAGEAIGYVENVIFPIIIEPNDAAKPIEAELSAFVGVCKEVCIPAKFDGHFSSAAAADAERLEKWQSLVPKPNSQFISSATALMLDGKPAVRFELTQKFEDIFVEGSELHYFKAPSFDGTAAIISVAGAKTIDDLKKAPLRVTGKLAIGGLEQMVSLV